MGLKLRWIHHSRVCALGLHSHNAWRDIARGWTLWLGPLALVWTPTRRKTEGYT